MNYPVGKSTSVGAKVLLDDGLISLVVKETRPDGSALCEVRWPRCSAAPLLCSSAALRRVRAPWRAIGARALARRVSRLKRRSPPRLLSPPPPFVCSALAKVLNTSEIGERKGVNLPGAKVELPAMSDKDKTDIAFGVQARRPRRLAAARRARARRPRAVAGCA